MFGINKLQMETFLLNCAFALSAVIIKIIDVLVLCQLRSIKFYFKKTKRCPPLSSQLLLKPAYQLSEEIRSRMVTSEAVIKAYISRIKDVNPILNAVMEERFEIAIQEAKNVEQLLNETHFTVEELKVKYPLLGVPVTIKESIAVKNLSYTSGLLDFKGRKATEDADVVKLIKSSGAIILLVSNTPECCLSFETFNYTTGTTNNPYDTRRTPGGSSGGEAALIGSGSSLIGVGSDLLGSIRLPAAFCGIWGHKPSKGAVSLKGHYPYSEDKNFNDMCIIGPLARYYPDLSLLLNVISRDNVKFPHASNDSVDLMNVKIYFLENYNIFKWSKSVDPEIVLAIQNIVKHLEVTYLCKSKKIELPEVGKSSDLFIKRLMLLKGFENILENFPGNYFKELLLHIVGKSKITTMHTLIGVLKSILFRLPQRALEKTDEDVTKIKNELYNTLGTDGVLLLPTHPTVANIHGGALGKLYDGGCTAIFNVVGFPATQCPVGLNSNGLPLGVQVISVTNNDRLTLRVAEEINKLYGGWIPPPFSETKVHIN